MDCYIGQILWFAFDFEVQGFMKCDGRTLQVGQNQALFSLLGNKYGGNVHNGTFMIPNLKAEIGSYQICVAGIYPCRKD